MEYPGTENWRGEHQNTLVTGRFSFVELAVSLKAASDKLTLKN
jgi:hypothetical protein